MGDMTVARLIETVDDPELGWLRDKHRDYFLALCEQAEQGLHGPGAGSWLDVLDHEQDNLRAALQ